MHITIHIDMDNDAFGDTDDTRARELICLLARLEKRLHMDAAALREGIPLYDRNGNKVGHTEFHE